MSEGGFLAMKVYRISLMFVFAVVLCAPLSAEPEKQQPAAVAGNAAAPAVAPALVWLDDALPSDAKTDGNWLWDSAVFISGDKSHGHASEKGLQKHGFSAGPVDLLADGMIVQQVWLDPKDPPKGIMLKFKLMSGEEVGVYWEGEEEVFSPGEDEQVWYYGLLPELGKWSSLEVLAEDLGLGGEKLVGVSFITFDGHVLWDKTEITQAPPLSEEEFTSDVPKAIPDPPAVEIE